MGGAADRCGQGSTDNPVRLTRSVKEALTRVTSGGAPVYVWPAAASLSWWMSHGCRLALRLRADAGVGGADRVYAKTVGYAALGGHNGSRASAGVMKDNTEPVKCLAAIGAGRRA